MPLLTLLVLLPALGSLTVAAVGRARDTVASVIAIGFAGATLGLAGWLLAAAGASATLSTETHPWIPVLGVSILFGGSGLSLLLAVWVALASVLALALTRPGSHIAAPVLFFEAMVIALFLAQDVFLVVASLGGSSMAAAFMSSEPRKVLIPGSAGFTLLFGWFAWLYRMVYEQTGFVSTELARWHALVLYPGEARSLFLLGCFAAASIVLALAIAMDTAPRAGRLLMSASVVPLGSYFVVRVLVPLSGPAAEAFANSVMVFATLLMASTFFARGWAWFAAGCQGLVLFGLFSFREEAVAGGLLVMIAVAVGAFGIGLTRTKSVVWFFVFFLIGLPLTFVMVPVWAGDPFFAAIGTVGFAIMAHRIVAVAIASGKIPPDAPERRSALWFAVPVVLWAVSMGIGWRAWEPWITPWAREFSSQSSSERLP